MSEVSIEDAIKTMEWYTPPEYALRVKKEIKNLRKDLAKLTVELNEVYEILIEAGLAYVEDENIYYT